MFVYITIMNYVGEFKILVAHMHDALPVVSSLVVISSLGP